LIRRAAALESDNLYFPREEFCKEVVSVRSSMRYDSGKLLLAVDIAGPFLLGVEGADAAIRGNLDLLGFFFSRTFLASCKRIFMRWPRWWAS
jgi:hypothetical protein